MLVLEVFVCGQCCRQGRRHAVCYAKIAVSRPLSHALLCLSTSTSDVAFLCMQGGKGLGKGECPLHELMRSIQLGVLLTVQHAWLGPRSVSCRCMPAFSVYLTSSMDTQRHACVRPRSVVACVLCQDHLLLLLCCCLCRWSQAPPQGSA